MPRPPRDNGRMRELHAGGAGGSDGAGVIPVLFEDRDVLVVDKPEGIAVIPERDRTQACLLTQLAPSFTGGLFVVHRLDKEASGVLVFAKHAEAHRHMSIQFSERRVWKSYLLVVHGILEQDDGVISVPLREFGTGRVAADPLLGKPCSTEYWLKERIGNFSVVTASPKTGRRHQIRAHFFTLGHPIVGDLRYGARALQERFPRLLLHARRLEVGLPSGRQGVFESPLPASFSGAMDGLQAVARNLTAGMH